MTKKRVDQIYTPTDLAAAMVKAVSTPASGPIADFSVGDGELLRAAAIRWPKAPLIGTDIDGHMVSRLKRRHSSWRVAKCDFLSDSDVARCALLKARRGRVGLVLLNPPFSCRGGTRHSIVFEGEQVNASPAMAFLLRALSFVRPRGMAIALLPIGVLTSEKDIAAWKVVSRFFKRELISYNETKAFQPFVAKTAIVRLQRREAPQAEGAVRRKKLGSQLKGMSIKLRRGRNQVHAIKDESAGRSYPVIHTTSLKDGGVAGCIATVRRSSADIRTAAVLIPRVGLPSRSKLTLHKGKPICLSDCVIALTVASNDNARDLFNFCLEQWDDIAHLYSGTGAPYITVLRVADFLSGHGASVSFGPV